MIDFHTHIYPKDLPNFNEIYDTDIFITLKTCCNETWIMQEGEKFRKINDRCLSLEKRLEDMETCGVELQVLSCVPILFSYNAPSNQIKTVVKYINDFLITCCNKYPDKFKCLGTLPMQDINLTLEEIKRNGSNVIGYQIGTNIRNTNLDNEIFSPIFNLLEEMGLILFIHPWDMMGQNYMKDYWLPWLVGMPAETSRAICSMIFGGIFDKFPKLKVVFAHGGGSFSGTLPRIQHGYNVRPDLCGLKCKKSPKEYCGHFWVDSLVHNKHELKKIIDLFGKNRVIFGTDYPFPLGELNPGEYINLLNIDENTKNMIRKKNFIDLIKY